MKQLAIALSLAALALPGAARAATFYVPNPDTGGFGQPRIQLEVSRGGPRRLVPIFIGTGRNGTDLTGPAVKVDNDEKPNVFNVGTFIGGPGMLKLVAEPGIEVRVGVLYLTPGNDTYTWALPVLSEENWFQPDETAFIQNLARTPTGFSNLEIMNFGTAPAACEVRLQRPKGSVLQTLNVRVEPVSHELVSDPFNGIIAGPAAGGLRAEVRCNRPFYAYGTFVALDAREFRLLYPLDSPPAPAVETVTLDRPGLFFAPTAANGQMTLTLPLVPGRAYRTATIDFDVRINKFTPIFTALVGMFRTGGARFNRTLYFGTFIRGFRSRTLLDQGSAVLEPALKFFTPWKAGGGLHHVRIVYDTESATVRMVVSRNNEVVADATGAAFNLDLADRGEPVKLNFGLGGVADHAYYPPVGWKFSNLQVRVTR